jgi:hypothetical protein
LVKDLRRCVNGLGAVVQQSTHACCAHRMPRTESAMRAPNIGLRIGLLVFNAEPH